MSLRRRPIETATYIPRANTSSSSCNNNGFGLTSSGALGFSDDIEHQLNMSTSCKACPDNNAKTSAGVDKNGKGGISCNRDAVASIQPFSSIMAMKKQMMSQNDSEEDDFDHHYATSANALFGLGDGEDHLETGAPLSIVNKNVLRDMRKTGKVTRTMDLREKASVELAIENAYVAYMHKNPDLTVFKLLTEVSSGKPDKMYSLSDVPHRVFDSITKLENKKREYTMPPQEYARLRKLRREIKELWGEADMNYRTYMEWKKIHTVSNSPLAMQVKKFEECMSKYTEASNFIAEYEAGIMKEVTASHSSPPQLRRAGSTFVPSRFERVPSYSPDGKPRQGIAPPSSSSLKSISAMLQQKTNDLRMKLGAGIGHNYDDEEEHEFCTCAEPQPVPVISHLGEEYCTCEEPIPMKMQSLGESMYCQCDNPVPVLSTGARIKKKGQNHRHGAAPINININQGDRQHHHAAKQTPHNAGKKGHKGNQKHLPPNEVQKHLRALGWHHHP